MKFTALNSWLCDCPDCKEIDKALNALNLDLSGFDPQAWHQILSPSGYSKAFTRSMQLPSNSYVESTRIFVGLKCRAWKKPIPELSINSTAVFLQADSPRLDSRSSPKTYMKTQLTPEECTRVRSSNYKDLDSIIVKHISTQVSLVYGDLVGLAWALELENGKRDE